MFLIGYFFGALSAVFVLLLIAALDWAKDRRRHH